MRYCVRHCDDFGYGLECFEELFATYEEARARVDEIRNKYPNLAGDLYVVDMVKETEDEIATLKSRLAELEKKLETLFL